MTADEFAELVLKKREAWEQLVARQGSHELPKPPEPVRDGKQGELW